VTLSDPSTFACPNCGAELAAHLRYAKLVTCAYCDSSVLLEDDAVRLAGKSGVVAAFPSLLRIEGHFDYRGWGFMPVGQARFDYGQGWWDEWWVIGDDQEGRWISVDEGDFALEEPVTLDATPSLWQLGIGNRLRIEDQDLIVTERGKASCIGLKGELPELLTVGDSFTYVHLSGPGGVLYTLELEDGKVHAHKGRWLDPFGIKAR
jgi:hypothetical protein